MQTMEWIISNPVTFYLIIGLVFLGADIFLIGLSPVVFIATGALLTSGLLYAAGWNPGPLEALALCAALSLASTVLGWIPLRRFQESNIQEDNVSDLVGREVVTTQTVTKTDGWVDWSGSLWQARLADGVDRDKVEAGVRMRVVKVQDLALVLAPVE